MNTAVIAHDGKSGALSYQREKGVHQLLQGILLTITRLPWLHANAGGVFLADAEHRRLDLVAHINFAPEIQDACAQVEYGHCLCGRVAVEGELLHVGCVDHRHDIHYEGMEDHGHYVVPIRDDSTLLGVLVLYVVTGHRYRKEEADTLLDFAATMATVINIDRLRREKALADLVVENSRHGVLVADRMQRILWVNRAFEETTGYRFEEIRGRTPRVLSSGRHEPEFYRRMWEDIHRHGQWQGEIWNRRKSGEVYPEFLNIMAVRNEEGEIDRYAAIFVDLTDLRRAEEHIHRLAYFDSLTGLPNRAQVTEKLQSMLEEPERREAILAVITFDLDYFHEINSALGRKAGDALLCEAARRLEKALGNCLLGRTEADRFLAVVRVPRRKGANVAEQARELAEKALLTLEEDFVWGEQALTLNATAGVAESLQKDSVDGLLERSALALQKAKRERRGSVGTFGAGLARQADYDKHIVLNIRQAVERGEMFVVYQPQVNQSGRITGAEALLRWHSPAVGSIPPDRFIPHAERLGAIPEIGRWVFEQTVARFATWKRQGLFVDESFTISVNLSPAQLICCNMVDFYRETCARHGVSPHLVELEVTETAIMQAAGQVKSQVGALSQAGFRIAIDDFGTGHSSLARLHEFPIDVFKIDRNFIARIEQGGKHLSLVRSMIAMAKMLEHQVVAEGVENDRQFALLRNLGCDRFQGYCFSHPLAPDEFEERLSTPRHMVSA